MLNSKPNLGTFTCNDKTYNVNYDKKSKIVSISCKNDVGEPKFSEYMQFCYGFENQLIAKECAINIIRKLNSVDSISLVKDIKGVGNERIE